MRIGLPADQTSGLNVHGVTRKPYAFKRTDAHLRVGIERHSDYRYRAD